MDPDIAGEKYILLETYRASGAPVQTPVWFAERGGRILVVTRDRTGKVKRIRKNNSVRIAACTMRGGVTGRWIEGTASILGPEETGDVVALRNKKYGLRARMAGLLTRGKGNPLALSISID